jgi:hypothetical protein
VFCTIEDDPSFAPVSEHENFADCEAAAKSIG